MDDVQPRTVYLWLKDADFCAELEEAMRLLRQRIVARIGGEVIRSVDVLADLRTRAAEDAG